MEKLRLRSISLLKATLIVSVETVGVFLSCWVKSVTYADLGNVNSLDVTGRQKAMPVGS